MGLITSAYDHYIYSSCIRDPSNPLNAPTSVPLAINIYVDDFVLFSASINTEAKVQIILTRIILKDSLTHFTWHVSDDALDVHCNQASFAHKLVERFSMDKCATSPTPTPY